jgi:PAS domain S-box-containing protein
MRLGLALDGCFLVIDDEGMISSCNEESIVALEIDSDDLVGQSITRFLVNDSWKEMREVVLQSSRGLLSTEITLSRNTGSNLAAMAKIGILQDDETGSSYFLIFSDSSKSRRDLTSSDYTRLAEQSIQGVSILRDNRLVYANEAYARISGYSREELLAMSGREIWQLIHSQDQQRLRGRFREYSEKGTTLPSTEYRIVRKDGEVRWVESFVSIIDFEGSPAMQSVVVDITEKKAARERAELYLQMAGVMFVALDVDARITLLNRRGREILGYKGDEAIGKSWFDHIPARFRKDVRGLFERLITGEIDQVEYSEREVLTTDGQERLMAWHTNVLRDDRGEIIGTISSAQDITEKVEAQNALKKSESKYRNLVEQSSMGIAILRGDPYKIEFANQRMAFMLGYSVNQLLELEAREIAELIPDAERDRLIDYLWACYRGTPDAEHLQTKLVRSDGAESWIEVTATTIMFRNEEALQVVVSDITERMITELALKASESKYRRLVETSPDAIILTDLNGVIKMVNDDALRLAGVEDESEAYGKTVFSFLPVEEHDRARWGMADTLSTQDATPIEFNLERPDGTIVPIEIGSAVLYSPAGKPDGFVMIGRDITQRKVHETELRAATERALLYLDLLGHDVRNQLQAIIAGTELAQSLSDNAALKETLEGVKMGSQRCEEIIRKVKATERLHVEPLRRRDISEALSESLVRFSRLYPDVTVETHIVTEEDSVILGDSFLEVMWLNLLENAVVHNRSHEKRVWAHLTENEYGYEIIVQDNGKGVPDSMKEGLFDIQRRFGGVGLHQSREIVEKYGGRISVEDRVPGVPSEGASFKIWLPKAGTL